MLWFIITFALIGIWAFMGIAALNQTYVEQNPSSQAQVGSPDMLNSLNQNATSKECPFCCETIKAGASKCPYCGEFIGDHLAHASKKPLSWQYFRQQNPNLLSWLLYIIEWSFEWTAQHTKRLAFFEVLDYASRLSVLIAVIVWFTQLGESQRQAQIQAWQIVSTGSQVGGRVAMIQGLELLNCTNSFWFCNKVTLEGINLENANLEGVNLPYANLSYSNLKGANLRNAKLMNASLGNLKEREGIVDDVSIAIRNDSYQSNTDLSNADLTCRFKWSIV